MKIFLSHALKDADLARHLTAQLTRAGFTVWDPETEIAPGDNWAKKIGKALDDSELMVLLLSPRALESDTVRRDIQFALGSKRYDGRVFSVFVGPTPAAPNEIPWILLKLPHRQVRSAKDFGRVVNQIRKMSVGADLSHANA